MKRRLPVKSNKNQSIHQKCRNGQKAVYYWKTYQLIMNSSCAFWWTRQFSLGLILFIFSKVCQGHVILWCDYQRRWICKDFVYFGAEVFNYRGNAKLAFKGFNLFRKFAKSIRWFTDNCLFGLLPTTALLCEILIGRSKQMQCLS